MAITEELGVTEQILIKGKKSVDFVDAQAKKYKHAMMYMPIIDINKPSGQICSVNIWTRKSFL